MELDDYVCELCWQRFDSPGDLAEHEQEEEERLYPLES